MDLQSIIGTATTVGSFVAFAGIVWWAYGAARRERFERDALAPFAVPDEAIDIERRSAPAAAAETRA